jgi:hypothetical protein
MHPHVFLHSIPFSIKRFIFHIGKLGFKQDFSYDLSF